MNLKIIYKNQAADWFGFFFFQNPKIDLLFAFLFPSNFFFKRYRSFKRIFEILKRQEAFTCFRIKEREEEHQNLKQLKL